MPTGLPTGRPEGRSLLAHMRAVQRDDEALGKSRIGTALREWRRGTRPAAAIALAPASQLRLDIFVMDNASAYSTMWLRNASLIAIDLKSARMSPFDDSKLARTLSSEALSPSTGGRPKANWKSCVAKH